MGNTWSPAASLNTARFDHSATLLPSGKVLVAAGFNLNSAEVYDPASNTWSAAASLSIARDIPTATLLSSGKVLVAGGANASGNGLTTAELYDPGLLSQSTPQPTITTATSPLSLGSSLTVSGTGFNGVSESSGGSTNNSATNYPLVQIRSLINDQSLFLLPDPNTPFSATSFASKPVTGLPTGYAAVTVFVNGIPSAQSIINIVSQSVIATTTAATNVSTAFSSSAQNVTLSATVSAGGSTVNEGTVIFQITNGANNIGTATTSATVSSGSASVSYTLPAGTPEGAYTIVATYAGTTGFSSSSDSSHSLTISIAAAATTTLATNANLNFSASSQPVQLTATVSANGETVNEGTVVFQLKSGSANIGSAVTSSTVSAGNASVSYVVPAGTMQGFYTIVATYGGTANFATSSDSSHTLTIVLQSNAPPSIESISVDRNPAVVTTPVNIVANAQSFSGLPLTYTFVLFVHLSPNPLATLQTGPANTLTYPFPDEGDFDIGVVVSDGFNTTSAAKEIEVFPLGPNQGTVEKNVFNKTGKPGYNNGVDAIGISVNSSLGGALNFDATLSRSSGTLSDGYIFTIPEQFPDQDHTHPPRALTAGKFLSTGIRVIEVDYATLGGTQSARLMVPIGAPETEASFNGTDNRASVGLQLKTLKAKIAFASATGQGRAARPISSTLSLSGSIELPSGLTPAAIAATPLEIGVSNIHTQFRIDAKGRIVKNSVTDTSHFKSNIKVSLPKLVGGKTAAGARLVLTFTMFGDLSDGFDTDGVKNTNKTGSANLQFAAIVAGVTYQAELATALTPQNGFGTIVGRR